MDTSKTGCWWRVWGRKLVRTSAYGKEGPTLGGSEQRQERETRMVGNSTVVSCMVGGSAAQSGLTKPAVSSLQGSWQGQRQRSISLISFVYKKVMMMIYTFKNFYSKLTYSTHNFFFGHSSINFSICINSCNHHYNPETKQFPPERLHFSIPVTPGNSCSALHYHALFSRISDKWILQHVIFCLLSPSRMPLRFIQVAAPINTLPLLFLRSFPLYGCTTTGEKFRLFLIFSDYEYSCYKYLCTGFCVNIHLQPSEESNLRVGWLSHVKSVCLIL